MKKKWLLFVMTALLALSTLSAAASAAETEMNEPGSEAFGFLPPTDPVNGATRGEVAQMLLNAANHYNPDLKKPDIIKGYEDGALHESAKITRAEAFTMVSRAFGRLTKPTGYIARISPKNVEFTNIPEWAESDVENLVRAGVLVGSDDGDLKAGELVTAEQVKLMIRRLYAYKGSNEKDDFYISANKNKMDSMEISEGESSVGGSSSVAQNTTKQVNELIREIVSSKSPFQKGSDEQKIRDLYNTIMDMDTRNRLGLQPLQPYFDQIDQAFSLAELALTQVAFINQMGIHSNGLLPFFESKDMTDGSKKVLMVLPGIGGLLELTEDYQKDLSRKIQLCGIAEEDAKLLAGQIAEMEASSAEGEAGNESNGTISSSLYYYSIDDINRLAPALDIGKMLESLGYDSTIRFQTFEPALFEKTLSYFTQENLKLWKTQVKLALLELYHDYLSQEVLDVFNEANKSLGLSSEESLSLEDMAFQTVSNYLSDEIGRLYVQRYFPPEAKKDLDGLVGELIATFKARVNRLDWMSSETKAEAIRKLDSLTVNIGYPDEWPESKAVVTGAAEGGNAFENMVSVMANQTKHEFSSLTVFTVNAAANRQENTLYFPAGILQPPFYDVTASKEENLAGIGTIIAHEITHIFDDQGAQYDSKGNLRDWWKREEHEYFKELCKKAEAFYDGWEAAPGIAVSGKNTLCENISDIGGMACVIDILNQMEHPDYDRFFRAHAEDWIRVTSREELLENSYDEHAPNNLRINRVLSNFQEFFDTYGIEEGDGMYVAPADRIEIW